MPDIGGIDWDRLNRALDRRFQKKWKPFYRNNIRSYRKESEMETIFQNYHDKLYVFILVMHSSGLDRLHIFSHFPIRIESQSDAYVLL